MVGGKDQQQFVAAFGDQFHRGDGHRRRRVAAEGFEQDRLARQVLRLQLFLDDEAVLLVAHQQRRLHAVEGQALDGLLEQGVVAGEGEELLGVLLAGKRPESRAAATGKDYWDHVVSPEAMRLFQGSAARRDIRYRAPRSPGDLPVRSFCGSADGGAPVSGRSCCVECREGEPLPVGLSPPSPGVDPDRRELPPLPVTYRQTTCRGPG